MAIMTEDMKKTQKLVCPGCDKYVGVACVAAECSFTLDDYVRNHDYSETSELSKDFTCKRCYLNRDCEDCWFVNTDMCIKEYVE